MVKWWKDRDKWIPRWPGSNPTPNDQGEEEEEDLPGEDIGDIADDDFDEVDDTEPPDRGPDS